MRSHEILTQLLEKRVQPKADVPAIDRRITEQFEETWSVVFLDMMGFSKLAAEHGIIPFLAKIHSMERICVSVSEEHSGFLLKRIADSLMLLFRSPHAAISACVALQQALRARNAKRTKRDRIEIGCGVGYGKVLKMGDDEVFGIEANYAAKLGEDLAGAYDVFVTPAAVRGAGRITGVTFERVPKGNAPTPYLRAIYSDVAEPAPPKKKPRLSRR